MTTDAARATRITGAFVLGALGVVGCHSRTDIVAGGYCGSYPPDSLPLPPIVIRASADSPGVVTVAARIGREIPTGSVATLDQVRSISQGGRTQFTAVPPGSHTLRVKFIGYHMRDTLITMPRDSALDIDVPLSRGGLFYCEDGEYERKTPWWKFW